MQWFVFISKDDSKPKRKAPLQDIDYSALSPSGLYTMLCDFNLPDPKTRPIPKERRLITWVLSLGTNATWSDIEAFNKLNNLQLTGWEAKQLKSLSVKYNNFMLDKELTSPYPAPMATDAEVKAQIAKIKAMYNNGSNKPQ